MASDGDKSYQTSATAIRQEAQATLREFRKQRIARRAKRGKSAPSGNAELNTSPPVRDQGSAPLTDHGYNASPELLANLHDAETADRTSSPSEQAAAVDQAPAKTDAPAIPTESQDSALLTKLEAAQSRIAALEEEIAVLRDKGSSSEAASVPLRANEQATSDPAEPGPGSLQMLPGIGSGMIWHLNNAGIASLDDLATADPDTLKARLGQIGKLQKIDEWIHFAQTTCDLEGRPANSSAK